MRQKGGGRPPVAKWFSWHRIRLRSPQSRRRKCLRAGASRLSLRNSPALLRFSANAVAGHVHSSQGGATLDADGTIKCGTRRLAALLRTTPGALSGRSLIEKSH